MAKRKIPVVGDSVACKFPVDAYYSEYGGNPKMTFKPGMVGVVASIAPKVRIVTGGGIFSSPELDGKDTFLVVDYDCPVTKQKQRVDLNFCNAVVVCDRTN